MDRRAAPLIASFEGAAPVLAESAWVAPGAVVVGDVTVGADSSIWYASVLRGDVERIRIGERTNVQDHCTIHVTRNRYSTWIGDEVTIGHRAVVHGCTVEDGALVGIGAIVLDGAVVKTDALVGAGATVTPGTVIESGMLALGTPAKCVRPLTDEERRIQRERTLSYVATARAHRLEW